MKTLLPIVTSPITLAEISTNDVGSICGDFICGFHDVIGLVEIFGDLESPYMDAANTMMAIEIAINIKCSFFIFDSPTI
ncbi:MAG: hypothetical protein Q7I96_06515 [Methanobacteriaceae archaeon]|nr:hypothetical protein [Methanobacteriaceae archaeon]